MSDAEQARFADWLAGDWLCAFDDLLTERWHDGGCTLCGAKRTHWTEIRLLPLGYAVAVTLCDKCHSQDPHRTQLDALLAQRYERGTA